MMTKAKYILFTAFIILLASCKAQQNLIGEVGKSASNQILEDSALSDLRNNNDIVIAYAVENFAWARKIDYTIIAQKNGTWKAYVYQVSLMKQNPSQKLTLVNAKKMNCDSLINYISQTKAWTIKGDSGTSFCTTANANCNINDAANERLWIITKNAVLNPSYYAPEFYQECCPDKQRALFLSIKNKIENCVSN